MLDITTVILRYSLIMRLQDAYCQINHVANITTDFYNKIVNMMYVGYFLSIRLELVWLLLYQEVFSISLHLRLFVAKRPEASDPSCMLTSSVSGSRRPYRTCRPTTIFLRSLNIQSGLFAIWYSTQHFAYLKHTRDCS